MRRFHFRFPRRLTALLLVVALSGCAGYPPEYLWRVLAWGDADVGDVDRFPARALQASPRPQHLPVALDEAAVQRAFETWKPGQQLDALLQDTGTQAFVVLHRGQVVYERYFHGARATRWSLVFGGQVLPGGTDGPGHRRRPHRQHP